MIDQTDPASLALLRYAIGFLCLLPPALLAGPLRFQGRDILPIALLGIAQFGILVALLNFGLLHISSALGAIIFATFPLLTLLLAASPTSGNDERGQGLWNTGHPCWESRWRSASGSLCRSQAAKMELDRAGPGGLGSVRPQCSPAP